MTDANLIAYKRANAFFKRAVKEAKRESLGAFTSNISPQSSSKKIWRDIKSLVGVPPPQLKCIRANNTLITAPLEISNIFATTWSKYSEDCNFNIQYRQQKAASLEYVHAPGRLSLSAKQLEYDFTELELETALTKAKGKRPGHDRISYPMLKQLPATGKAELLNLYNNICWSVPPRVEICHHCTYPKTKQTI